MNADHTLVYLGARVPVELQAILQMKLQWQKHLDLIAQQEPVKNFEYRHVGSDGRTIYLRVNAIPTFHNDGTFKGYLGSSTDITELVLAKNQAEQYSRELETAKNAAEELARTDTLGTRRPRPRYCAWCPQPDHLG